MAQGETVCTRTHFPRCDSRGLSGVFDVLRLSLLVLLARAIRLGSLQTSFSLLRPAWQKQSKDESQGSHCLQTHCTLARSLNLCVERQHRTAIKQACQSQPDSMVHLPAGQTGIVNISKPRLSLPVSEVSGVCRECLGHRR